MAISPSWRAVIGVFLIFAFGCLAGSTTTSLVYQHSRAEFWQHGPEAAANAFERRFTRDLALRPDQAQAVHQLFLANFTQRRRFQREIQPQIQRANAATFSQIRLLLDPDQRVTLDRNVAEFRYRMLQDQLAHREHPGGPIDPFAPAPPTPPLQSPDLPQAATNRDSIQVPPIPTPDR